MSYMTHLECARCAKRYATGEVLNLCECGAPLFARYDLRRAATQLEPHKLKSRPASLWRYKEVLPVGSEASIISLGEGFTPLLHARRLGDKLGVPNLYLKDESQNPTGSFKARGMAVAVSKAHELGIRRLMVPSAGNAGYRCFVTDSTVAASGNFGAIVVGGSTNFVPVYSDGANWRIG